MTFKTHMTEDEMVPLREKLDDLRMMSGDKLNHKDWLFVYGLEEDWKGNFTTGQAKHLENVWSKYFESF